jgi:hypothetical protein
MLVMQETHTRRQRNFRARRFVCGSRRIKEGMELVLPVPYVGQLENLSSVQTVHVIVHCLRMVFSFL